MKKRIIIGILAHVDAGKTTLSEALLYRSGQLRAPGRVDHGNTFLDSDSMERERGITIFSKQARFSTEACDYLLLDTPGHVDFSPEAERTLSLLDYAILVISGPDGVQNHTRTLWQLLEYYRVPTLLFVNKTDITPRLQAELHAELAEKLSPRCAPFYEKATVAERDEALALSHESLLERVLTGETVEEEEIARLLAERELFPVLFGSALRMTGVDHLLDTLDRYTLPPVYGEEDFGGRVYKISRASAAGSAARLTYVKVTSGRLSVRDELTYLTPEGKRFSEKISQLRLYSGEKFRQVDVVEAGDVCAAVGLSATYVGQGLGTETDGSAPVLEPVLSYRILLPPSCDLRVYFPRLKELEEEEPSLHLSLNREYGYAEARLMGDIQIDLLRRLVKERLGVDCELDEGQILYKETPAAKAIGVGHFEPLRHYAEVQLLIEPQPRGTGLVFDTRLPENSLELNWQRLILSHLYEKTHRGTRTGALLTDARITLVAGKAHLKHTEGGDFREATFRALRHGLMKAGCTLLEPYCRFRLELPAAAVGRAMTDLQNRHATFSVEESTEETAVLSGRAPVATLLDYHRQVTAYTRGQGRLTTAADGYEPCHNTEEVVAAVGYDPEADPENTPHSVFCAHGAGFVVNWREVDSYKHLEAEISLSPSLAGGEAVAEAVIPRVSSLRKRYRLSDGELEAILLRTFGPEKPRSYNRPKPKVVANSPRDGKPPRSPKPTPPRRRILLIDGYNLIYAWDILREVAESHSLEKARETLMDILSSFVAYTKTELVLVFDAYLVKDGQGSDFPHDGYRVVYTTENQTADAYIERFVATLGPEYSPRVVTGDRLLQISALHSGGLRVTAAEFIREVNTVTNEIAEFVRRLGMGE